MQGDPKVVYSIMMKTRLSILAVCANSLMVGLTIATRYAVMRTQFRSLKNSKEERQIIDYQTHQIKLANCLGNYFCMNFVLKEMSFQYDKMIRLIEQKDFSLLNPIHINLSGIKALFTTQTFEDIKVLREACGGAGFLRYSGFWTLHDTMSPLVTLEGDSVVMSLQTARALLKTGRKALVKDKKIIKQLAYLEELKQIKGLDFKKLTPKQLHSEDTLLELIKANALLSVYKCLELFN